MRTDHTVRRDEVQQARRDLGWIERAEAETRHRTHLGEHFHQVGQLDLRLEVLTITAEMDPGENDLFESSSGQTGELADDFPRLHAAALPSRKGNDAKRAEQVATFLYF